MQNRFVAKDCQSMVAKLNCSGAVMIAKFLMISAKILGLSEG